MKTKEELNALKEEVKDVNKKLAKLTEEELAQVSGGSESDSEDFITGAEITEKPSHEWSIWRD